MLCNVRTERADLVFSAFVKVEGVIKFAIPDYIILLLVRVKRVFYITRLMPLFDVEKLYKINLVLHSD